MKFLKYFEGKIAYKRPNEMDSRPFREIDLAKFWGFINDLDFMKIYYDEYNEEWKSPKKFFHLMLQTMLVDKEIEFHRIVNPIDSEISYNFAGRVKSVFVRDEIVVDLYDDNTRYVLTHFYAGKIKSTIIKIYNSEITEIEQKLEDIEMKLDAKKYNL
jgi:hypothetical protein